jgi:hypothetical protein
VEKLGVLVPFEGIANLRPHPPVERPLLNRQVERVHGESAKTVLKKGQGARFLQNVQEINKKPAVLFSEERRGTPFCPSLTAKSALA